MTDFEMTIAELLTAETEEDRAAAKEKLRGLMEANPSGTKLPQNKPSLESEVRRVLLELGVPDALKGHRMLASALQVACENPDLINAITSELYPAVAKLHNDTASRVERAIRHAIEVCWDRCDLDVIQKYFGNTVSPNKGKPTNGEFIARVANVVRERMVE